MKNSNKFIVGIIVVLVVAICITAYLNRENVELNTQQNNDAIFTVFDSENETNSYNMSQIQALGETNFKADLKSDGKSATEHEYTGVLLKLIYMDSEIELSDKSVVIVTAADGYAVSIDIEKVIDDDNVYLVYKRDGELIHSKENGGDGPYQVVIRKDVFSQYWCKYALSTKAK